VPLKCLFSIVKLIVFSKGILELSKQYKLLRKFGKGLQDVGDIRLVRGISSDFEGIIWMCSDNKHVCGFTIDGKLVRRFDLNFHDDSNKKYYVDHVIATPDDNLIIIEIGGGFIKVDKYGKVLVPFIRLTGPGGSEALTGTRSGAFDPNGNFAITEKQRISVFDSNLTFKQFIQVAIPTFAISCDPTNGNFIVTNSPSFNFAESFFVYDNTGNVLKKVGSYGGGSQNLKNPFGVDVDGAGNIIICDYNNYRIQIADNTGNFVQQIQCEQQVSPMFVCVHQSGCIVVVTSRDTILVFGAE
jgi:hypothetical protein